MSDNQVIPEAAILAAARAMKARCGAWDSWTVMAQMALEAAAPHMLADAWDAGHRDSGREFEQAYDIVTPDEERFIARNPYKPTP